MLQLPWPETTCPFLGQAIGRMEDISLLLTYGIQDLLQIYLIDAMER